MVSCKCYKLRALQASKTIPDTTITSYFSSTSSFQKKFSSSNFPATFRRLSGEVFRQTEGIKVSQIRYTFQGSVYNSIFLD